jgi:hypothetical protein
MTTLQGLTPPPHLSPSLSLSHSLCKVHIFDYDGNYIRQLEDKFGDLIQPGQSAIQPGIYAPLSTVISQSDMIAGNTVIFPITLNDHTNKAIDYVPSILEEDGFKCTASTTTMFNGIEIEAVIPGEIVFNAALPNSEAYSAKFQLNEAGITRLELLLGTLL